MLHKTSLTGWICFIKAFFFFIFILPVVLKVVSYVIRRYFTYRILVLWCLMHSLLLHFFNSKAAFVIIRCGEVKYADVKWQISDKL